MKVIFRTNLDDAQREEWPTLTTPPHIGDFVRSTGDKWIELEVHNRTFYTTTGRLPSGIYERPEEVCECELHLKRGSSMNISQFEEWYRRRKGIAV